MTAAGKSTSPADTSSGTASPNLPTNNADVLSLFKAQCYSCHGENGTNQGNVGNILDLTALEAKKLIVKKDLASSRLYQRIISSTSPMPPAPKAPLSPAEIKIVEGWIMEIDSRPVQRTPIAYDTIYQLIQKDFLAQSKPLNVRYLHLVHLYNSGATDADIEIARKGIYKMLNMLSTTSTIVKPTAIDENSLVFRVNLEDYDLESPDTLYTKFLRNIYPKLTPVQQAKYVAVDQEHNPELTLGGRWKEIFEAKPSNTTIINPAKHVFQKGLPLSDGMASLAGQMIENKSKPIPLMRGDWFVSRVASDMGMRLYYNLSGFHPTTVDFDSAMGIDDTEGMIVDNDPNFDPKAYPKKRIIRAGFNDSGVSINHRVIERVPLDWYAGHPLWRGYEFRDALEFPKHNLFNLPVGPILNPATEGNVGYECVHLLTPPTYSNGKNTLLMLNNNEFYPTAPLDGVPPQIVTDIKNENDVQKRGALLAQFESIYGHQNIDKYAQRPTNSPKVPCDSPHDSIPAFEHEGFEYQFLRANGLQGFLNVNQFADLLDYKLPNQRARENKDLVTVPAFDQANVEVVGAPVSCLGCHRLGYLDKRDQVANYVRNSPQFSQAVKDKVARLYRSHEEFSAQIAEDNKILMQALAQLGITEADPEPVSTVYKRWAQSGMSFATVAGELYMTEAQLHAFVDKVPRAEQILNDLLVEGSTLKRSRFEQTYGELMCLAYPTVGCPR